MGSSCLFSILEQMHRMKRWSEISKSIGKMPKLIYQEERNYRKSVKDQKTSFLWETSNNIIHEMGRLNKWTYSKKKNHVPGKANK